MPAVWPTPDFTDGQLVDEDDLNQLNENIDDNHTNIVLNDSRIDTLEANQGTRGANGTVYGEIGTLKTNQGTRGALGTVYGELGTLITRTTSTSIGNQALYEGRTASGAVRCVLTADQAVASGALQKVSWPAPVYNTGPMTVTGTDFTLNKTGRWALCFSLRFGPSNTGTERAGWIGLASDANTRYVSWGIEKPVGTSVWPYLGAGTVVSLSAGTVLSVYAYQDTGANLDLKQFGGNCNFSLTFLGA
ncbi:hypothetical protein [Amycolatopsis anabasis]|uniref:hypothetical protein n=1 Tax=Amycolatopsis anabasis TaxID=1840409 RepID=UPI00131C6DEC|nr:hypothetical protein [Amycolatopsis anabasis]